MNLEQLFVVTLVVLVILALLFSSRKSRHGSVPEASAAPAKPKEEAIATKDHFQNSEDIEKYGNFTIKGVKNLRRLGGADCTVVAIFGPTRQGKSFLMNALSGQLLFLVQDDPLAVSTEDIHISTSSSFSAIAERGSASDPVVLIDTGGIGEGGGVARDARLVTSILGLSRVVIFNWKGGLQRDNILQQLGVFINQLSSMLPSESKKQKQMGFLHIVLRDIDLKSPGDEFQVSDRILLQEQSNEAEQPETPVSERNLIRKRMEELFKGIQVWCFPYPFSKEGEPVIGMFSKTVDGLRTTIAHQIEQLASSPTVVTGLTVAQQLPDLLASEPSVEPSSPCSSYQKCAVKEAISVYQRNLHSFSQALIKDCPMSETRLRETLVEKGKHLKDELDRSLAVVSNGLLLSSARDEADDLWSFQLQQALDQNRAVGMGVVQREISGAKDRVVRRLSEQFQDEDASGEMDDSIASEEEVFISQECPWLQEDEAQTVKTELTHFTDVCINEMDSVIKNKAENLRHRLERDAIRRRRQAEEGIKRENVTKHKRKKQELQQHIEELKNTRMTLTDQNQMQETQIAKLTIDNRNLHLEMNKERDRLQKEIHDLQTRSDDLQENVDCLEMKLRHAKEENGKMAARIKELEDTVQTERAEKHTMRDIYVVELRKVELIRQNEAETFMRDRQLMQKVNEDLTRSFEALQSSALAFAKENEKSNKLIHELEGKLKQEIEKRQRETADHGRKLKDMSKEKQDLEKSLVRDKTRALAERDKANQLKEDLEKRMSELNKDIRIQREANCSLLHETDELREEIVDLEDKVGGSMANWQWQDDHDQWKSYDDHVAVEIEKAYIQRERTIDLQVGRWCYEIDLSNASKMAQKNLATGKIRKVKREKMTVAGYPKDWEPQTRNFHLAQVPEGRELEHVKELFYKTMWGHVLLRVERIQRRELWREYQLTKLRMRKKNKGIINVEEMEMELFHGTRNTKPEDIYLSERGFDMRYASKGMWGRGCYFAENASYSHMYSHKVHGTIKPQHQMLLAKVLTGIRHDNAPIDYERTKPDPLPDVERDEDVQYMYDSLNGITRGSKVHIIFDNGHAYPYYLITYGPR
jgi:hypothetical protein